MVEIKDVFERYKLNTAPLSDVRLYWNQQVEEVKKEVSEFEDLVNSLDQKDYEILSSLSFKKSYAELLEEAVSLEQYKKCSDLYEPVTRVVKIKIDLPRPLIEKYFNLKTISIYGIGLYAPIEGLLLSASFRNSSNYDESFKKTKDAPYYDLSTIPEEIQKEYVFRLTIPASDGLFVPKRCEMTEKWLYTIRQLEYFGLS